MRIEQGTVLFILCSLFWFGVANAQTDYEPLRFTVSGYQVTGDNPIGDKAQQVLQPFTGEQAGLEGLSAAADALESAIIEAGFSFHRVNLPPQQLTSGTVELRVLRFGIGAVNIRGNEFFDEENILHSLPELAVGATPNTKELSRSLKIANNHASKNMVLKFTEGGIGDTIDADITVQDRSPQLIFLSLDNTGSADSEEIRSTVGYQHGNLFNRDHALTATLTIAPEDPDATTQIGLNYHIPFYEHGGTLDFLLSDSEVDSGEVGDGVSVSGQGSVFGVSYRRPLLTDTNFNHHWTVGLQNKLFENQVDLSGSVVESDVLSMPLELGYGFNYLQSKSSFSGGIALASNIESGSENTDENYAAARTGATTSWSKLTYELSYDRSFAGNWLFHLGFSGQQSDDLLISGEQFGVGGASTLRGFEERSVTGDTGTQISIEFWTPPLVGVNYLFFIDQASLELNEGEDYDLSSYGLGLRWSWKQQLSLSLDYAVINEGGGPDPEINQDDDSKAHFSLLYRF